MKYKLVEGVDLKEFKEKLKANDGYCLCSIVKNDDSKCMCKSFIESGIGEMCECGIYIKIGGNDEIFK